MPEQILEYALSIAADMRALWERRREIGARAVEIRGAAEAVAREHGVQVASVCVELENQRDAAELDMHVHYIATDGAMRPGLVPARVPGGRDLAAAPLEAPWGVSHGRRIAARHRLQGAHGRIDAVAAAIALAAPEGPRAVLARLSTDYGTLVRLPKTGAPLLATLSWIGGTIQAEISMPDNLWWSPPELELCGLVLPETVIDAIAGACVDEIADLPFRSGCAIRAAESRGPGVSLTLRPREWLVDLRTGAMWEEPRGRTGGLV